jgi:PIN domain nuclease of toxin-antitoxin system
MRVLLDTHVFLWYVTADARLPNAFADVIRNPTNEVFLSVASIWEAVIKFGLGKLSLPSPPADYLPRQRAAHRIESLAIGEAALPHLASLPPLHRDPFDRMLIAQALEHGLTIASLDPAVRAYPARCL